MGLLAPDDQKTPRQTSAEGKPNGCASIEAPNPLTSGDTRPHRLVSRIHTDAGGLPGRETSPVPRWEHRSRTFGRLDRTREPGAVELVELA